MNVQVVMINKKQMVKGFCSSCSPQRATRLYLGLPNLMWHLWLLTAFCITAAGTETLVVWPTVARQTMIYMISEWGWGTFIWKMLQSRRKAIKKLSLTGRRGGVGLNFKGLQVRPGRNDFKCCNQKQNEQSEVVRVWFHRGHPHTGCIAPPCWYTGVWCQRWVTAFLQNSCKQRARVFQPRSEFCLLDAVKDRHLFCFRGGRRGMSPSAELSCRLFPAFPGCTTFFFFFFLLSIIKVVNESVAQALNLPL